MLATHLLLHVGKFNAYENDIRVPFYVRGPGVPAGVARDDALVNNVDIGATVLELGGSLVRACLLCAPAAA